MTITIHYTWCDEHCANHWLDERDHCYGESLDVSGYTWPHHIGGGMRGWYSLRQLHSSPDLPLDWQMALDEHVHVADLEVDF
jgi:hypothetical protein